MFGPLSRSFTFLLFFLQDHTRHPNSAAPVLELMAAIRRLWRGHATGASDGRRHLIGGETVARRLSEWLLSGVPGRRKRRAHGFQNKLKFLPTTSGCSTRKLTKNLNSVLVITTPTLPNWMFLLNALMLKLRHVVTVPMEFAQTHCFATLIARVGGMEGDDA